MIKNSFKFVPHGIIAFQSDLTLEEVAELLSKEMFSGHKFGGKEECIHEEVPAIYIENTILGFRIILDGYSGLEKDTYFNLHFEPIYEIVDETFQNVDISCYLNLVFAKCFSRYSEIKTLPIIY